MKKIRIIILLLIITILTGCATLRDIPFSESDDNEIDYSGTTEINENNENVDSQIQLVEKISALSTDAVITEYIEDMQKQHTEKKTQSTEEKVVEESNVSTTVCENNVQQPETVEREEQPETQIPDEQPKPVPSQPVENEDPVPSPSKETEPEPEFDIAYWISYAKKIAINKGLILESSAIDCWDNPITANPDCIYLERDISSRLSRYAKDEDITDVWIWYECIGTNRYLIYIGYA